MKKYYYILKKCPLFNDIDGANLISMLGCFNASVKTYSKKETIIAEGEAAKYIGILLNGSAQIINIDYFGNRSIVSNIESSEMFGESFACAEVGTTPISVVANEDCEVLLIDCNRIMHPCSNGCNFHQQIIFNLMKIMAVKNIMFHQKIEITSKRSTREKLLTYLTIQAKKCGSNSFDIPFDRQELADYLQVDRSGLSAEISKMRNEGILKSKKYHFELL